MEKPNKEGKNELNELHQTYCEILLPDSMFFHNKRSYLTIQKKKKKRRFLNLCEGKQTLIMYYAELT